VLYRGVFTQQHGKAILQTNWSIVTGLGVWPVSQ
jgi:hypothetical protein